MLQSYLEKVEENEQNENDDTKNRDTMIEYISHSASLIGGIITCLSVFLAGIARDNVIALNIEFKQIIMFTISCIFGVVLYIIAFKK